jgi:hypothetical protein
MNDLLMMSLAPAVLIATDHLSQMAYADVLEIARRSADVVAEHGDDLQFGGRHCQEAFAALAQGIAACSFAPGGVTFRGERWQASHPECPQDLEVQHGR